MLQLLTKLLRDKLTELVTAHGGKCGRAADREAAIRWMLDSGADCWHVAISIAGGQAAGTPLERRSGLTEAVVRVYIGLPPGAAKDADKRADDLLLFHGLVWSWLARIRFGSVERPEGSPAVFNPLAGFLDGFQPMVPGAFEVKRATFRANNGPGNAPGPERELLLLSMDWTAKLALPLVKGAHEAETDEGDYLFLN